MSDETQVAELPSELQAIADQLDGLPDDTVAAVTHPTAAHVYRCDPQPCR